MPESRLTLPWTLSSSPRLHPPLGYGGRLFPISQALGGVADGPQRGDLSFSLLLTAGQVASLCCPTSHCAVWFQGGWGSGRSCGNHRDSGRCLPIKKNTDKRYPQPPASSAGPSEHWGPFSCRGRTQPVQASTGVRLRACSQGSLSPLTGGLGSRAKPLALSALGYGPESLLTHAFWGHTGQAQTWVLLSER